MSLGSICSYTFIQTGPTSAVLRFKSPDTPAGGAHAGPHKDSLARHRDDTLAFIVALFNIAMAFQYLAEPRYPALPPASGSAGNGGQTRSSESARPSRADNAAHLSHLFEREDLVIAEPRTQREVAPPELPPAPAAQPASLEAYAAALKEEGAPLLQDYIDAFAPVPPAADTAPQGRRRATHAEEQHHLAHQTVLTEHQHTEAAAHSSQQREIDAHLAASAHLYLQALNDQDRADDRVQTQQREAVDQQEWQRDERAREHATQAQARQADQQGDARSAQQLRAWHQNEQTEQEQAEQAAAALKPETAA